MTMEERLAALQHMTTAELRAEWRTQFCEDPRSGNVPWMRKRLAWGTQAKEYGGLSEAAKARIEELIPVALAWMPIGHRSFPGGNGGVPPTARGRLKPGTTLTRRYKGLMLEVQVREDDFEYDGRVFGSLTAVATAVTGAHWSGTHFFGLAKRKSA